MSVLTVPTANTATTCDELPLFTLRRMLPDPRTMAGQALPRLAEATLIPLVLFYGAFWAFGVEGALAAALVYSYGLQSEEHTSELQSQFHLVCRLLLEKKKKLL